MDSLVAQLSEGRHPVEVSIRPAATIDRLKECIDRGYVYVKFTGTRGGTELGVTLDRDACQCSEAQLQSQSGIIHLEGGLTLNYTKVRCTADIDLSTLKGDGFLTAQA
jgi:hypothetical protein